MWADKMWAVKMWAVKMWAAKVWAAELGGESSRITMGKHVSPLRA